MPLFFIFNNLVVQHHVNLFQDFFELRLVREITATLLCKLSITIKTDLATDSDCSTVRRNSLERR